MSEWMVECRGDARELYVVEADSAEEAMENWATGFLHLSEASGMDPINAVCDE